MFSTIKNYCNNLTSEFESISKERKELLETVSLYIATKLKTNTPVNLVYICTHNSRRSHFGQIWAKVASSYYNIQNINSYSGGTEATAFNKNAIDSLIRVGFNIKTQSDSQNPVYHVLYSEKDTPIICFSKTYNDKVNPKENIAAIMTCSDAEENCPFIPGVELRIGTTYDDPKSFDNTPLQEAKYDERCKQIALETLYVFYKVK